MRFGARFTRCCPLLYFFPLTCQARAPVQYASFSLVTFSLIAWNLHLHSYPDLTPIAPGSSQSISVILKIHSPSLIFVPPIMKCRTSYSSSSVTSTPAVDSSACLTFLTAAIRFVLTLPFHPTVNTGRPLSFQVHNTFSAKAPPIALSSIYVPSTCPNHSSRVSVFVVSVLRSSSLWIPPISLPTEAQIVAARDCPGVIHIQPLLCTSLCC